MLPLECGDICGQGLPSRISFLVGLLSADFDRLPKQSTVYPYSSRPSPVLKGCAWKPRHRKFIPNLWCPSQQSKASVLPSFDNAHAAPPQTKTFLELWPSIWMKSTLISSFLEDRQCGNTQWCPHLVSSPSHLEFRQYFWQSVEMWATIGHDGGRRATLSINHIISKIIYILRIVNVSYPEL